MTSNQALFASYLASAKSSATHAVELGHKLSGQEAKGFQRAHAELLAAVRHMNSALESIDEDVMRDLMSVDSVEA